MRYFWTFFWTFLLVQMVSYVTSSMQGAPFDFKLSATIAIVATVFIFIITAVMPSEPVEKH
ncbi:YjzD family protein [Bacillus sp. PS06]|uniref:YjzD family protein n=1 Tax=Bacillus sp. PS06 TaxID=2764176 RepID=UPI00177C0096|nr:YjzD family protein [Bacillus sp. PS06]MBD8067550.1 YjzD family protein [Bacillus sp. PS06]